MPFDAFENDVVRRDECRLCGLQQNELEDSFRAVGDEREDGTLIDAVTIQGLQWFHPTLPNNRIVQ